MWYWKIGKFNIPSAMAFSLALESLLWNADAILAEEALGCPRCIATFFAVVAVVHFDLDGALLLQALGLPYDCIHRSSVRVYHFPLSVSLNYGRG
jgi:hypothetical protein